MLRLIRLVLVPLLLLLLISRRRPEAEAQEENAAEQYANQRHRSRTQPEGKAGGKRVSWRSCCGGSGKNTWVQTACPTNAPRARPSGLPESRVRPQRACTQPLSLTAALSPPRGTLVVLPRPVCVVRMNQFGGGGVSTAACAQRQINGG